MAELAVVRDALGVVVADEGLARPRRVLARLAAAGVAGARIFFSVLRLASSKSTIHVMDMLICLTKYTYGECHRVAE